MRILVVTVIADSYMTAGPIATALEGVPCITSTPNLTHLFPQDIPDVTGTRDAAIPSGARY